MTFEINCWKNHFSKMFKHIDDKALNHQGVHQLQVFHQNLSILNINCEKSLHQNREVSTKKKELINKFKKFKQKKITYTILSQSTNSEAS